MATLINIPPPSSPQYLAAQEYTARGWRVFPCHCAREDGTCSCRDPKCEHVGKHPIGPGSTGASRNPDQIRRWWTSYPWANPAIVTGEGLMVVDVDNKPAKGMDGLANWVRLVSENGGVPETVTAITGSGGRHVFFAVAQAVRNYQAGDRLAAGIDIRGHNGYVIAPPSRHASGNVYRWVPGHGPNEIVVAVAPAWLIKLVTGTSSSPSSSGAPRMRSAVPQPEVGGALPPRIEEGTRHMWLLRIAGALRNRGLVELELLAVLGEMNRRRCVPPQTDREIEQLAHDAARFRMHADLLPPLPPILEPDDLTPLKSVARTMWRQGLGQYEIAAGLATINALRGRPPLHDDRLIDIIAVTAPD